jgi:hypothetical protein
MVANGLGRAVVRVTVSVVTKAFDVACTSRGISRKSYESEKYELHLGGCKSKGGLGVLEHEYGWKPRLTIRLESCFDSNIGD